MSTLYEQNSSEVKKIVIVHRPILQQFIIKCSLLEKPRIMVLDNLFANMLWKINFLGSVRYTSKSIGSGVINAWPYIY